MNYTLHELQSQVRRQCLLHKSDNCSKIETIFQLLCNVKYEKCASEIYMCKRSMKLLINDYPCTSLLHKSHESIHNIYKRSRMKIKDSQMLMLSNKYNQHAILEIEKKNVWERNATESFFQNFIFYATIKFKCVQCHTSRCNLQGFEPDHCPRYSTNLQPGHKDDQPLQWENKNWK